MRRTVSGVTAILLLATGPALAQEPAQPQQSQAPQQVQTPQASAKPAQSNDDVRISGTVEKFNGGLLSLSPSQGVSLTLRFDAGPGVNAMRKAKASDLKVGQQVAVQAKSNPAGGMMASQVIVYEQGSEGKAGDAASTDPSQIVAKITEIGSTNDGPQLSLQYKEGERKITLAKEVAIWIARPASADDIKPGALVTIAGRKPPEGEVQVMKASIGPQGADNPPL